MRQAILQITYNSADISGSIAPFVTGFEYTDHAHGKADDLQITLKDSDQRWKSAWYPAKGAKLAAKIVAEMDGQRAVLDCGTFEIDEVEASGPPERIVIKAASAAVSRSLRTEKKTVAWEHITLREVAGTIAQANGMTAYYEDDGEIDFDRLDQREESDLAFLSRVCAENGLNLKVAEEKLILFSGKQFEAKEAAFSISRQDAWRKTYRFTDKAHDIYRACTVSYQDAATKQVKSYTFEPSDGPGLGEILKVNRRVESLAAAQRVARSELRQKNMGQVKGDITMLGHPGMVAALNVQVGGFGQFDSKYFIDEAQHRYDRAGTGYTVGLAIHRVLGY